MAEGRIIIAPGVNVWDHERRTADALARAGYTVEFLRRSEGDRVTSADVVINGVVWEMKAPTADNLKANERNLKRGRWQSGNIIFDSRRMRKLSDEAIRREVARQAGLLKGIRRLWYVDRSGNVATIK